MERGIPLCYATGIPRRALSSGRSEGRSVIAGRPPGGMHEINFNPARLIAEKVPSIGDFMSASQAKLTLTVPHGPKSAWMDEPCGASMGRMKEPARTICPASIPLRLC